MKKNQPKKFKIVNRIQSIIPRQSDCFSHKALDMIFKSNFVYVKEKMVKETYVNKVPKVVGYKFLY